MKKILKALLMPLLVIYPVFGVVACKSSSNYSPTPAPIATIDITFASIAKMTLDERGFLITILQTDVSDASDLPDNFWVNGSASLSCRYDDVLVAKVGLIYDFNQETEISVVQTKLQTMPITSVAMTIWGYGANEVWELWDFIATLA